jgi:bifunctional DNA-binding transcriptional regulator/antitoxin component of YhaV-PrlF toxin-antitoxin module
MGSEQQGGQMEPPVKSYRFAARIERGEGGGAWVIFPHDVRRELGTAGQVRVEASFDGVPYRGSLAPMAGGRHVLGVRKEIRERLGKDVGDTVAVVVACDLEERRVELPAELAALLRTDPSAREQFERLSYTRRREHAESVAAGKRRETRARRAARIVEQLRAARE